MAVVLGTPFKCGGTPTYLQGSPTQRLVIRVDDLDATAKVYIRVNGGAVSTTNADFFLNAGEALELREIDPKVVSIVDASDNPYIFWSRQ